MWFFAFFLCIIGTPAEQFEARRRQWHENRKARQQNSICQAAGKTGKGELVMRKWSVEQKKMAAKASGFALKGPRRTVGKVFWDVNRTLGALDDPW